MSASTQTIESAIEAFENDAGLFGECNFARRDATIDWLDFHVIDNANAGAELQRRAGLLQDRFAKIDAQIFQRLRDEIRLGKLAGVRLRNELHRYVAHDVQEFNGYNSLDALVNGLLHLDVPPQETLPREAEMVFYQPTPARIILALIDKARISSQDVFYDLGSGLGQVCILVNLLTGAKTRGIEFEPAFCDYASECARSLNLQNVEFINRDAREIDYAEGTVFFLYTPFKGKILEQVLQKLRTEAQAYRIRIGTFGACSQTVARESWLKCVASDFSGDYEFAVFKV